MSFSIQLENLRHKTGGHHHEILRPPFICVDCIDVCLNDASRKPAGSEKPSMQSRPFEEKLAALLDDETLCVVHVDFTKLDTDAILNTAQAFVDRQFDKLGLSNTDRDSLRTSLQLPGDDLASTWRLGKIRLKAERSSLSIRWACGTLFWSSKPVESRFPYSSGRPSPSMRS